MKTEAIIDLLLKTEEDQILDISLAELDLSKRVHRSLLRYGVGTIGDLAQCWAGIRSIHDMDEKGYWQLSKAMVLWYLRTKESCRSSMLPADPEVDPHQQGAPDPCDHSISLIEVLELAPRTYYMLKQNKINTIGEIYQQWDKLASLRSFGPATLVQIQKALDAASDSSPANPIDGKNVPGRARRGSKGPSTANVLSNAATTYSDEIRKINIEALDLPARAYNALKHNHIDTVGQIVQRWDQIGSLVGIGSTSTEQIYKTIQDLQTAMGSAAERLDTTNGVSSHGGSCIRKSIYHLKLFDGTYPLLIKNGIHTIDQMTRTKLGELKSRGILDTAFIWDIRRGLHAWLRQDETLTNTYVEWMREEAIHTLPEGSNFEEHFYNLLQESLTPVQMAVIEHRYGLKTGTGLTLAKTATVCGLTSACVWYIESSILTNLRTPFVLREIRQSRLILKMRQVIEENGGFVAEPRLLQELQAQLGFQTYSMEGVVRLIRELFDEEIRLPRSDLELRYIDELEAWATRLWDTEQIVQAAFRPRAPRCPGQKFIPSSFGKRHG